MTPSLNIIFFFKLKVNEDEHGDEDPDTATLSKKFSFFEKGGDGKKKPESDPVTSERAHAVKEKMMNLYFWS